MRRLVGGEVLVLSVIDFNRQGIVANLIVRDLVPHPQNPLDKQIAATALLYDLILSRATPSISSTPA